MIENKDSELFVYEQKAGELAGFIHLYPIFSSTRMKKMFLLNDLFVAKALRGKGISKKLIEHAKDLARKKTACAILLETEKSNSIGNLLYPKMGFEIKVDVNF
ncbi:MAG: GNAT family N-acetyltransferase [Bacteroidota bacterium]